MDGDKSLNEQKRLPEEGIRLLDEINETRLSELTDSEGRGRLDQLIAKYNGIMDIINIESSPRSLRLDPLKVFPSEIWQDILLHAECDANLRGINQILLFTLVSKLWQHKIISSPILWTNIHVRLTDEDLEASLTTAFHLSANLLLDIDIQSSWDAFDVIYRHVLGQGHRIRSLSLAENYTASPQADELLLALMGMTGNLTSLEEVTYSGNQNLAPNACTILKDAVQVKSLDRIKTSPEFLQSNPAQHLRHFTSEQTFEEIIPYIYNFGHLRTLHLTIYQDMDNEVDQFERVVEPDEKKRMESVVLPSWSAFPMLSRLYINYPDNLGWRLLNQSAHRLEYLSIELDWTRLFEFITMSADMTRLESLQLCLPPLQDGEISSRSLSASPGLRIPEISLKKLDLIVWSFDDFNTFYGGTSTVGQAGAKHLADIMTTWIPNIEYLDIQAPFGDDFIAPYIQSLRNLVSLDFRTNDFIPGSNIDKPSIPIPIPSIDRVSVSGRSSLLGRFTFPNIRHLSLCESRVYSRESLRYTTQYESISSLTDSSKGPWIDNWTKLVDLDIADQDANWTGISLPSLEALTIGYIYEDPAKRISSSSLLAELASKCDAFPRLQRLNMRYTPEWDLLFIMLERRNFSFQTTLSPVTPITSLALTGLPPPFILRPLVSRLGRRLTRRPSNYDLSLQSLAEIYFDFGLAGCDFCNLSYLPCQKGHKLTNKTPEVLIYPRTSEEVVAAACERAYWWADAIRMVGGRAEPCERHSCFNWKEINANTDMGYIGGTDRDPSEPSDGYSLRSHSFFGDDVDIRYDVSH